MSKAKKKKKVREPNYQLSILDKRRGGQPGNTNAVKHGLYSPRFAPEEIDGLKGMREGLLEEIDLARVQIGRLLEYETQKREVGQFTIEEQLAVVNLINKSTATIARLMQVNKALLDANNADIGTQLLNALQEVSQELIDNA